MFHDSHTFDLANRHKLKLNKNLSLDANYVFNFSQLWAQLTQSDLIVYLKTGEWWEAETSSVFIAFHSAPPINVYKKAHHNWTS